MHYTSILPCNETSAAIIQASLDVPTQELATSGAAYWASAACLYSSNSTLTDQAWKTWVRINNYGYIPSAGAGIFFLAAFGLSFLLHAYQLIRSRGWLYICTEVGLVLELWGWGTRYHAAEDITTGYVFQLAGLTCAPTMFATNIYCLFTQFAATQDPAILRGLGARKTQRWLIIVEVLAIAIQVGGASLAQQPVERCGTSFGEPPVYCADPAATQSLFDIGCNIMLAGIILQLVLTVVFLAAVVAYFTRLRCATEERVLSVRNRIGFLFWGIVVMDALIIIRGAYRTAELTGGIWGPIATSQIALILGDAVPMLLVVYGLNATHTMWTVVPFERAKEHESTDISLVRRRTSNGSSLEKAETAY